MCSLPRVICIAYSPMSSTDFAVQKAAISGRFDKDSEFNLLWRPQYVTNFPTALAQVPLPLMWKNCKFVSTAAQIVPDKCGVYCFAVDFGPPFPERIHVPLYFGKAANQFLSERFDDYLKERHKTSGREKIVIMLNLYRDSLYFWWAELPRVYVDVVEEHLIMCCKPPCNTTDYDRGRHWGKAFE